MDGKKRTSNGKNIRSDRYQTYLLRCWSETGDGERIWRFSLEDGRRSRRGFANLETLATFLQQATAATNDDGEQ